MVSVAQKNILLIVLATALLATSFAGCLTEDAPTHDHDDHDHDGHDSGAGGDNDTAEEVGDGNTTGNSTGSTPTANLTAAIDNSTAPANVTFTLEGSDADGDTLEWTLDWDGDGTTDENGTDLPATVDATFEEPGNYTARLVVTDKDGSANATVDIEIVAPVDADDGMCHRPDAIAIGPFWYDDRPADGSPNGFVNGDGTWIYEESNGVPGLQVGHADEIEKYQGCENPDTLIF